MTISKAIDLAIQNLEDGFPDKAEKLLRDAVAERGEKEPETLKTLTKREHFAGLFLQAQLSRGVYSYQGAVQLAIEHADELLKQLSIKRWVMIIALAFGLSSCGGFDRSSTDCAIQEINGCEYVVCVVSTVAVGTQSPRGIAMTHAANCKNKTHDLSGNH